MTTQSVVASTIPIFGTQTPEIDLVNPGLNAILLPNAGFTPAVLTFQTLSADGVTWIDVYYDGNPVTLMVGAQQFRDIDPTIWLGITKLRIRSGTLAAPVVQQQPVDIQLIGYFDTVPPSGGLTPSTRRVIYLDFVEQICEFPAMTANEADVCTFDLSGVLNPGEIILTISDFGLVPLGPLGMTDTDPTSRTTGAMTISGNTVSQQFGNFGGLEMDDGFAQYLVVADLVTTQRNSLTAAAKLTVNALPSAWVD